MSETRAATVHFGRLERRGLMLGLSAAQTAALGVAVIVAVLAEYTQGVIGLLLAAPLWGIPAAVALLRVAGRPIVSWLPVVGHWRIRRALSQARHRVRLEDIAASELELPGVGRRLRLIGGTGSGAALIHDPRESTITAALSVSGVGFVLADACTQERRVAGWGRLLASLCQQPSVIRLQVLERCLPGGGARVRRWWADHALTDAPWAARVLAELVGDASNVSDRHESFLAISIRTSRSGRRGATPASLAGVEQQLAAVAEGARAADLDVHGWVTRRQLPSVLRATYDPVGAARSDRGESPNDTTTSWLVGPMAVDEDWESLRTDSAHHAVYWVQEWPRSEVHAGFLQPILLAPGARRALSLIAEPVSPAKAMRDIRRAKVEHAADADQRARMGRLEDEATRAEASDLVRREQELVSGHGDLRFVGLLTVSAASAAELDAACVATESAAAQALCEIRRLVGQQGQAFAAGALPLARSVS